MPSHSHSPGAVTRRAPFYIGTSGWSYKHWKEIFYPKDLAATGYLPFYAREFGATEINTSFYHLPQPETLERWFKEVPGGFRFCPKISRYITHVKKLNDPETTLPRFFSLFEPYKKKLGPILLQLPANVPFRSEKAQHFFKTLHGYKGYRFALEIRHDSWLQAEPVALLKKYKIALVIASSGDRWPCAEVITTRHIYLRFHGPDGSYGTSYTAQALRKYAKKCLAWQQEGHTIWAFFNNDGHGYALKNARALLDKIRS